MSWVPFAVEPENPVSVNKLFCGLFSTSREPTSPLKVPSRKTEAHFGVEQPEPPEWQLVIVAKMMSAARSRTEAAIGISHRVSYPVAPSFGGSRHVHEFPGDDGILSPRLAQRLISSL